MKECVFIICILFLSGCWKDNDIKSLPKNFQILNGKVYIEGKWKELASTAHYKIIPKYNSVSIICSRETSVCIENQALLITKNDNAIVPYNFLYPEQFTYNVTEWSDTVVKAERNPLVADVEIRISLVDKSVEKSFRETQARGSNSANSNIVGNWILK